MTCPVRDGTIEAMAHETSPPGTKKRAPFPPEIEHFGQALRLLRAQRNLSQQKLAKAADINRSYLSDVERGLNSISLHSIIRVAKVLDVKLSDLFLLMEQHADTETAADLMYEARMKGVRERQEQNRQDAEFAQQKRRMRDR